MTKSKQFSGLRPFGSVLLTTLTVRASRPLIPIKGRDARLLTTILFLLLIALPAWRIHAHELHKDMCYKVALAEPIYWATSGVWSEDEEEKSLLVVDALKDEVLGIRSNGEVARIPTPFEIGRPSQIRATRAGFFLEDEALNEIAHLDRQLELVGSTRVQNRVVDLDSSPVYNQPPIDVDQLNFGGIAESMRNFHSAMLFSQDVEAARATRNLHGALSSDESRRRSSQIALAFDGGHRTGHKTFGVTADLVQSLNSGDNEPGPRNGDAKVVAIYDWSPMGEGILAFGDLKSPQEDLQSALLYFDEAGRHQIFYRGATIVNTPNLYRLPTMRYIATLGDTGYILSLDGSPMISEVRLGVDGVHDLRLLPEGFRDRPRLEWQGGLSEPRQMTNAYKTLESSTLAEGLYSWDNSLYLLAKRAAATNGATAWWLIRLDPQDGKELSRVRLPTAATHLTVIPGDFWALIEKGPVQGIGGSHAPYMETSSMVLVPAAWLEFCHVDRLNEELKTSCEVLQS